MDCDLSHHPKYIKKFIEKQQNTNADIVTGSRYITGGGVFGWTAFRKFTSIIGNFVARVSLGSSCSDLTGSFRLYKHAVIEDIISKVKSKGYSFQMEIIILAEQRKLKIMEVSIFN